jgi:hypothetical protein
MKIWFCFFVLMLAVSSVTVTAQVVHDSWNSSLAGLDGQTSLLPTSPDLPTEAIRQSSGSDASSNPSENSSFFVSFTISASSGAGGSISPTGNVIVSSGANQLFTMNPNTGKRVDSVIVDGVNQGQLSTYTFFNVVANHTIRAIFATIKDTIFASSGTHGSIVPNGPTLVNFGSSKTFSITPATAYHVDSVIVDGVYQGHDTTYTFTNVTTNHTIRASFAINQ